MKRILRNLVAGISIATMMFTTSCKKQEEDLSLSEPKLTIDQSDLKFEEFGDDKAITFTWDAPEGAVTSILMITKATDTGFASCTDYEVEGTSKTFTSADVRDMANALKADLSVGAEFIAKVMVSAGAGKTAYSNVVSFKASKDNSAYETIYPIGAMDWGWEPSQAEMMKTDDGIVYTWTGMIKAKNSFKFLCQNDGNWIPSYNRDETAENYWTLYKKTEDWQPDTCFEVEKGGQYTITLNIKELTISVEPSSEGFGKLYPMGATPWGWTIEDAEEMTTNDGITYTWTGHLIANNDFKFLCQNTAWQPSYNRDPNADDYWTAYYKTQDWEPDTQWVVETSGIYTLTINVETLKVTATPQFDPTTWEKIYPIGAMEWGWDPSLAEEMTTEDGVVYTWTGNITANLDFKFLCQNDGNWIPSYNRDADAAEYWTAVKKTDETSPDNCFKVEESAKYQITLNTQDLTVKVEKIVEAPGVYPVGGSFPWGWDNTLAEPMMTWNGTDYFYAGWLNVGTFKFLCYKDSWVPYYTRDVNAEYYWTMIYCSNAIEGDPTFEITEAGRYIIELNTETLEISCVKDPSEEFPLIYPIGAMAWGWNLEVAEHMYTFDGESYFWIGEIKADNDFKFMCSNTEWIPSYNRDEEAEDYWTAFYKEFDWQKDTQFKVSEGGIYRLTLNVKTLKVTAERLGDVQ